MQKFLRYNQEPVDRQDQQRQFEIQAHHIQYQTNDSQASDTSYESSLSSNQDKNCTNAEYFREEMSRFFINYPELLNQSLVGTQTNQKSLWGVLSNDIINEAKQQPISLQGIAKRIAFYRQKTQQIDIIDLIVKEKDIILKQLQEQAKMYAQENMDTNTQDKNDKKNQNTDINNENVYYSWKKRQQATLRTATHKNTLKKSQSSSLHTSLQKDSLVNSSNILGSKKLGVKFRQISLDKTKNNKAEHTENNVPQGRIRNNSKQISTKKMEELVNDVKITTPPSQGSSNLKNILKFQPKTQIGKQLLQQIRKHNPNDEIGIKKIIVNFLTRHRQTMKKNILNKSNINERLSKLHIEDSKQLLLFCPLKKSAIETDLPLNTQTNNFLQILTEISSGHLMKYWKLLQERKL